MMIGQVTSEMRWQNKETRMHAHCDGCPLRGLKLRSYFLPLAHQSTRGYVMIFRETLWFTSPFSDWWQFVALWRHSWIKLQNCASHQALNLKKKPVQCFKLFINNAANKIYQKLASMQSKQSGYSTNLSLLVCLSLVIASRMASSCAFSVSFSRSCSACTGKVTMSLHSIAACIQENLANAKVSVRQPCMSKTDFDVKLALKVILGHSFCNQLQADKG